MFALESFGFDIRKVGTCENSAFWSTPHTALENWCRFVARNDVSVSQRTA